MAPRKKAVRKKATTKRKTVARRKSTGVATSNWEERLAEEAAKDRARTGTSGDGNIMSIRGGKFTFQGEDLGNELKVVILEYAYSREYYDAKYDPENPSPPACFTFNADVKLLKEPHETSPNPQSSSCADCLQNEWGSSGFGNSKACGSKVSLAVADPAGLMDEDYKHATMRVGVNSMLNWDEYVKGLTSKINRPAFGVVTRVYFDEDSTNPILKFELDNIIDNDDIMEQIFERRDTGIIEEMTTPHWDLSGYEEPSARKKPVRKKTVRKKKGARSKFSR